MENNAPNIVAAMLVSPLMGPVMSITFGAIISDRQLMVSAAAAAAAAVAVCSGKSISIFTGAAIKKKKTRDCESSQRQLRAVSPAISD